MALSGALERRVPPAVLGLACAGLMALVARAVPAPAVVPGRPALAALLVLAGLLVAAAGVAAFRRHGTTVDPRAPAQTSALVVDGIYRHTRNPMYLGFLLALAGWGVLLANWAACLLLPAFVLWLNAFQIGPEERALARAFGPPFEAYCRRVRRWI